MHASQIEQYVSGVGERRLMVGAGGPSDPPRQPLELWVAETATGQARRLLKSPEQGLSSIFDECAPPNPSLQ